MIFVELIERFQTAIVGVVGFAGVIITLLANARIAERTRKRERKDRAAVVATLIQAEMRLLLGAVLLGADVPPPEKSDFVKFPVLKTRFSDSALNELGVLTPELCSKVIMAISTIHNIMAKTRLLGAQADDEYISVPAENCEMVSRIYSTHIEQLTEAVIALEEFHSANA
jgi:hypothetical protein